MIGRELYPGSSRERGVVSSYVTKRERWRRDQRDRLSVPACRRLKIIASIRLAAFMDFHVRKARLGAGRGNLGSAQRDTQDD
jgi:hypothetical protein